MKIYRNLFITLSLLAGFHQVSFSQIEKSGTPWTLLHNSPQGKALVIHLPEVPVQWEAIVSEQEGPGMKPLLFAWPEDTSINVVEKKNRIFSDASTDVYQLKIVSPKAWSLNLIFTGFYLPEGAEVYLYTPDYRVIRGAYTSANNQEYRELATTPVPGNEVVVEVVIDKQASTENTELVIGRISADQLNVFGEKSGHFGRSGDCNVDINCPPGANWQVLKRSVAKFIRGGTYLCTGALINNTANDGKPYLLTANHCISTGLHARLSVFYFNYESPDCRGGDGSVEQSVSGSDLIATTSKLDFALVELKDVPPESYQPYYAGWDRNVTQFWDTVTCIHHPSGDVKKISKANRRVVTGDFGSNFDANVHWYISQWDLGTTEGGSSGSPLFNQEQRIIGDLTGGDASCSYNFNDYFMKFSVSWNKYADSVEQLKCWLDPGETGALVWNGYDPYQAGKPVANFTHRPEKPAEGHTVRFVDNSTGSPSNWFWTFEDAVPATSSERNPLTLFTSHGLKTVTLIVSNPDGVDTLRQTLEVIPSINFRPVQSQLVTGANAVIREQVSPGYDQLDWEISEGIQTWFDTGTELSHQFMNPGEHHIRLSALYDGDSYHLYHQNAIRIVPDKIIFSGEQVSVYDESESLGAYSLGEYGLIPGSNTLGYEAFANQFEHHSDTVKTINGVTIDILEHSDLQNPGSIDVLIWDRSWNEVFRKNVTLNPRSLPFRLTAWLDTPVGMDSVMYAGFEIQATQQATLAAGMTLTRGDGAANDAWGRINGNWNPLSQVFGLNSAISVRLETSNLFPSFKEQIKAWYQASNSMLNIDLSGLVYRQIDLSLFDMTGRKLLEMNEITDSSLQIYVPGLATGVYLINIRIDAIDFASRVLVIN